MIDSAIDAFFTERKELWLKNKIKSGSNESEINDLKLECEAKFSYERWLPDAAIRAKQRSLSTHPCTFSHPSARNSLNDYVTSVISNANNEMDGYLRSGNVAVKIDSLGSAAALDVYKFLSLIMADSKRLIDQVVSFVY